MANRFQIFVDGSNLIGSIKKLGIKVSDYQNFYRYVFQESARIWRSSFDEDTEINARLIRVYWYQIGTMDDINLDDPKLQANLKLRFDNDKELKRFYMPLAAQQCPGQPSEKLSIEAWSMCFKEATEWYQEKKQGLYQSRGFNEAIRNSTDFVEMVECGHWKVNLLHRTLTEKGVDTALAVDMVTMSDNFEVAVLISGDADSIPSVNYLKGRGKHVGVIDLIKGYPPERKGRQTSTKLQSAADFVVPIYEMDLVKGKLGQPFDFLLNDRNS